MDRDNNNNDDDVSHLYLSFLHPCTPACVLLISIAQILFILIQNIINTNQTSLSIDILKTQSHTILDLILSLLLKSQHSLFLSFLYSFGCQRLQSALQNCCTTYCILVYSLFLPPLQIHSSFHSISTMI
jgi:hypothetical protein